MRFVLVGPTTVLLAFNYETADPLGTAFGTLQIEIDDGFSPTLGLIGDLAEVGFLENQIQLSFGVFGGSHAADFGSTVLVVLDFHDPLGPDPFAALVDNNAYDATVTISAIQSDAAVPLPNSVLMLGSALGLIGLLRARREKRVV